MSFRFAARSSPRTNLALRAVWPILAVLSAAFCTASLFAADTAPSSDIRLRVAWGGGEPRRWEGTAELSSGQFSELVSLGVEADQVGTITLDGNRLNLRQRAPRTYDGFDVLVTAPDDARLTFSFAEADGESPTSAVAVGHLLKEMVDESWGAGGNRLLVMRAPGDALRVTFPDERDALVFAPGETFKFDVRPHRLPIAAGSKLRLRAAVLEARGGREQSSQEVFRDVPADAALEHWPLEIKLPDAPGVYDIQITAHEWGLRQRFDPAKRFVPGPALATRIVQVVVVERISIRSPATEAIPFEPIVELDPANPRWWQRYMEAPQLAKLKLVPKHSWTHGRVERWLHPHLGAAMAIDADAWEALPLPVDNLHAPHIVEIEYPSDMPQSLGISVLDPNAADQIAPVSLDSGVVESTYSTTDGKTTWLHHRLIFWPRTKAPVLLLTNRDPSHPAVHGKIRVLAGPARLPPANPPEDLVSERMFAAYLDRPLLPENFCASEWRDAWSGRSLDDWTTMSDATSRMADYLHYVGYNGAMVSVFGEGSALYPSRLLEPNPRHDTGSFFSTGQDPLRKDALELMLRVFERERLALIPAVRFNTPLPALEKMLAAADGSTTGLIPVGPEGLPWTAVHATTGGAAPYYNILDSRVQQALLDVIDELVLRYGRQPALGGIALQLDASGYSTLPGIEWSLDDVTWAAFERDSGVKLAASGADRYGKRAEAVVGPNRRTWLDWRAAKVALFHQKAAAIVAKAGPDVRLFITTAGLADSPAIKNLNKPSLTRATSASDLYLAVGLDTARYARPEFASVVLVPTRRASGPPQLHNIDLPGLAAPTAEAKQNSALAATLFFHESAPLRLPSFDKKSPFGEDKTYTRLSTQFTPSGAANRRRFAETLAASDAAILFDGGALLPLGQEEHVANFIDVFRRLSLGFRTLGEPVQGVTIRTRDDARRTLAYVVNSAPWPATLEIDVQASPRCRVTSLSPRRHVEGLSRADDRTVWRVQLAPYDLVAVAFSEPGVALSIPRVDVDPAIARQLERQVKELHARTLRLANPPLYQVLANPGFEAAPIGEQIPGWQPSDGKGGSTAIVGGAKEGVQAAALTSAGRVSSFVGELFDIPASGRLAIEVMLRTPDGNNQPPLRVALETESGRKKDYRWWPVGAGQPKYPVNSTWGLYLFSFEDLPAERGGQARLRFDLMGAGEVLIDDIKLHHLSFSENERIGLGKIVSLADSHLAAGRIADCARVLDGYWPKYLTANVPLEAPPIMQAQRPDAEPAKPDSVMDRLKKLKPF